MKEEDYRLSGLIGKPELSRGNRNYENLFINGRFIKNRIVSSAVEDAYKTRIMIGKFPVYVLNLEVDAAQVDVNVHPAKLEVRFKNDDEVYDFFYDAISSAFQDQVLIPRSSWEKKPAAEPKPQVEQQSLVDMILQRKAESLRKKRASWKNLLQWKDRLLAEKNQPYTSVGTA